MSCLSFCNELPALSTTSQAEKPRDYEKDSELQTILPHSFGSHFLRLELPKASTSYPSLVSHSDNSKPGNGQLQGATLNTLSLTLVLENEKCNEEAQGNQTPAPKRSWETHPIQLINAIIN